MGLSALSAQWIFPAECEPFGLINNFPQPYIFAGAYTNLDRWVREGTPPPRAEFLSLSGREFVNDEFGNVPGGLRPPWLDVPTATLCPSRSGQRTPYRCADSGYCASLVGRSWRHCTEVMTATRSVFSARSIDW